MERGSDKNLCNRHSTSLVQLKVITIFEASSSRKRALAIIPRGRRDLDIFEYYKQVHKLRRRVYCDLNAQTKTL